MEVAALDYGVHWGAAYDVKLQVLPHGKFVVWDHIPPWYLESRGWQNPYAHSTVWCTVRHPTARIVSIYKQHVQHPMYVEIDEPPGWHSMEHCTPAALNKFVQDALEEYQAGIHFGRDGWIQPQSSLIWGGGKKWCQHVLRLEEGLATHTNELMARLGSPVRLPPDTDRATTTTSRVCGEVSTKDLNGESLRLIHEVYHEDFERLGYVKGRGMPGLADFPARTDHRMSG